MPFSLGQILGGWKRRGDAKKAARKTIEFSRKRGKGIPPPTPSLTKGGGEREGYSASQQSQSISSSIKNKSALAWQTIIAPHISEKGSAPEESRYIFKVANSANKHVIKQAIEERYGVSVNIVHVINMPPKPRKHGQALGKKPGFKKALILLKEGQSITEF